MCPFAHTQRDGQGNMLSRKNRKPYHPNRDDAIPTTAPSAGGWDNYKAKVSGIQDRLHGPKFNVSLDVRSKAWLFVAMGSHCTSDRLTNTMRSAAHHLSGPALTE